MLCDTSPPRRRHSSIHSPPPPGRATAARPQPETVAAAHACAGFSLGEYTALVFGGVLDVRAALRLIKARAAAMAAAAALAPSGMMTVIGLDDDELGALCARHGCSIANQLFPKGRVVAGAKGALAELEATVKALPGKDGLRTIVQPVSGGFHSEARGGDVAMAC